MERFFTLGRYVFGIAIACFGIQHYMYVSSHPGLAPGPPWIVGGAFAACLAGALLLVTGIGVVAARQTLFPAAALGTFLFLYVLFLYVPLLAARLLDPNLWTSSTELLAMCGSALVLAGTGGGLPLPGLSGTSSRLGAAGRYLYAFPLAVFGVQHLMYSHFVATLVPAWIPWRYFWGCFVGVAFIAASIGIAVKVKGRLAASLMGVTFFLFVVLLHAPRVFAQPHNNNEVTSALVAVAMCGGSLVVARSCRTPVIEIDKVQWTMSQAWADVAGNPRQSKAASHLMK